MSRTYNRNNVPQNLSPGGNSWARLRAAVADRLARRREAFIRRARRTLLIVLSGWGPVTIDPVRDLCPLPQLVDPRIFGAVPGPLADAGIIGVFGFEETSRPSGHGRLVTIWDLLDSERAEQWLAENPELPDLGNLRMITPPNSHSPTLPITSTATAVAATVPVMEA